MVSLQPVGTPDEVSTGTGEMLIPPQAAPAGLIRSLTINDVGQILASPPGAGGVYNVQEYGAVGDGTTNDTLAFQAAVDDAAAAGGGTVLVPATGSDYMVNQIRLKSKVRLQGIRNAVIRLRDSQLTDLIVNDSDADTECEVVDLYLHDNKDNQGSGAYSSGIWFEHTTSSTIARHLIHNVGVRSFKGDGIHMSNYTRASIIDNVAIYHCDGIGLVLGGADTQVSNVDVGQSGRTGVYVAGTAHQITNVKSWLSGRVIEDDSGGDGFLIAFGHNTLVNCFSQESRRHGYLVFRSGQDVTDLMLIGCKSNSDGVVAAAGFHLNRAKRVIVDGIVSHTSGLAGQPTYGLRLDADCEDCDVRLAVSGTSSDEVTGTVPGANRVVVNSVDLRLERLHISAADLMPSNGSPVIGTLGNGSATTNRQPVMLFDPAATEVVSANLDVPENWASFDIYFWWSNAGGGTGEVVWGGGYWSVESGDSTDSNTAINAGSAIAAPAQYTVTRSKLNSTPIACTTGEMLRIQMFRWGSNAADTVANDVGIAMIELVRVGVAQP